MMSHVYIIRCRLYRDTYDVHAGAQDSVDKKIKLQNPPPEFEKLESPNHYAAAAGKTETVLAAEECMQQWIKTIEMVGLFEKELRCIVT